MPCIVAVYAFMINSNREFSLRQNAIQQWYEFFERLNLLMQDYTIDYEEYFNRQMVWCVAWKGTGENFKWETWLSGYCTEFTAYWNKNTTNRNLGWGERIDGTFHDIYKCSKDPYVWMADLPRVVEYEDCWKIWKEQSFGQYKSLFIDVNDVASTADDKDLWMPVKGGLKAIMDADNVKELYLISHDWKKRLYFRRKMVVQDWENVQYKIQMLRLKWFDAGRDHNFDSASEWLYDGQIDTWACDASMWFNPERKEQSVWRAYSDYYLPQDVDDCWVDLTYWSTSIYAWNLSISPLNDSDLYWAEQDRQINPYMKIFVVNSIFSPLAYSGKSISEFKVPIETAINMKDFYKE